MSAAWDDLLERDGQVLVLVGNDVTLLSPLASEAALYCTGDGVTVAALTSYLEGVFGAPPSGDPGAAVREVLAALQERAVLSITR
ncbi:hypothetical protein [Demequina sediminis]|uniref:hypothetical protein n=1 Tax=Demequina sediminis TaxID=1930058 RepID=UPI00257356C9|nr:hypothetical protein [Demequina sediminis]